jgi:hypothetical protein
MQSVILIDDCGTEVDLDNPALARRLHTSRQGGCLLQYVVLNLGFVAYEERLRSWRIRLRPSVVSKRALARIVQRLLSRRPERVAISSYDEDWVDELLPSAELALQQLTRLMVGSHRQRASKFECQDVGEHQLPPTGVVAAILQYWRSEGTDFTIDRLIPLLHRGFDERFLVAEHFADSNELIIRALGNGYSIFDKKWSELAPGERFEDQYDVYYGRWAAQGYRAASDRAVPVIQRMDAVIDKPVIGYRRERYARIIVPFRQNGRKLLLSASTTNLATIVRG